ncbi:DivIVA domain-containing protein [Limnochorda pilosa]|uniref:Cell division protein DivIVA n=1 Tax=Limnochorda pilosa TaxID=1555112 RepID=A0A0K2SMZ1_LIMPI|nr:DivIVA domain-containing protein [Limnochorda pilosa]BAS28372.1 hypothetical protein LIP_2542 [Limnochorda pilosa]
MLTPRELRQIEFRRVFRGYDPQEVDEFLTRLIEEYEKSFKERSPEAARARAGAAEAEPAEPRRGGGEPEVREAVELARQAAEELRSNAQWEARLILDQARQRAARIEEEARQQAGLERTRLRELREEADRLLRQLRRLTDEYLQGAPAPAGGSASGPPVPTPEDGPAGNHPAGGEEEERETQSFPISALQRGGTEGDEEEDDRAFRRYGRG